MKLEREATDCCKPICGRSREERWVFQMHTSWDPPGVKRNIEAGSAAGCRRLQALAQVSKQDLSRRLKPKTVDLGDVADVLARMSQVTSLDLSWNSLGAEGTGKLAEAVGQLTSLLTLNLSWNSIGPEGAGKMAAPLGRLTNLQTLYLSNNAIEAKGAGKLAASLGKLINLQTLYLSENSIGDDGAGKLATPLGQLTNLQNLDLQRNSIGAEGAGKLAAPLKQLTNLQTLYLRENSIGVEGAGKLAATLGQMTNLQTLYLGGNSIGVEGAGKLAIALGPLTNLRTLNLTRNSIGDEGANKLAGVLGGLFNLQKLLLSGNSIEAGGASKLAESLWQLSNLQEMDLDVEPRMVAFGASIPLEKLNEGWVPVLRYLAELKTQGAVTVSEVRLVFAGEGRQGKSSLMHALLDESGRTPVIADDDRTVGIDVHRGWQPEGAGGPTIHLWDLAGQEAYGTGHSAIITPRCVFIIVFSPENSSKCIVEDLRQWLQMMHSQSPGAYVMLVCTRFETPPQGVQGQHKWQRRVDELCQQVSSQVNELVCLLNREAVDEVDRVQQRLKRAEKRLNKLLKCERAEREHEGFKAGCIEAVDGELDDPRAVLQSEISALSRRLSSLLGKNNETLQIRLLQERVWTVECVNGDGRSVHELRKTLVQDLKRLPLMSESVPRKWVAVRQAIRRIETATVLTRSEALVMMGTAELGLNDEDAWAAVAFWGLLGDVKVHRDILVPNVLRLIDLLRPIVHHDPIKSLLQMERGQDLTKCDAVLVPRHASLPKAEQASVMKLVKELEQSRVLKEALLPYLYCWEGLAHEQRQAALEVLAECNLIVRCIAQGYAGESSDWLATCRLLKAHPLAENLPASPITTTGSQPIVLYRMHFVPPGLFATFQAFQLVNKEFVSTATLTEQVDSTNLRMKVKTVMAHKFESVRASIDDDDRREQGRGKAIKLECSTVALLRSFCCGLEKIMLERFPGLTYTTSVRFSYQVEETETIEWELDPTDSTLGALLDQKEWDHPISATVLSTSNPVNGLVVRDVVGKVSPLFFLSHSWNDSSTLKPESAGSIPAGEYPPMEDDGDWWRGSAGPGLCVVDDLSRMLEGMSREMVWADKNELRAENQFQARMREGVGNARCVVVCLSLVYLASQNCLYELAWAMEDHAHLGKHILVVSVDPDVTFNAIREWDVTKDRVVVDAHGRPCTVGKATLRFVAEAVAGLKIYEEWIPRPAAAAAAAAAAGEAAERRRRAVGEMLVTLRNPLPTGSRPAYSVRKADGVWSIHLDAEP